MTMNENAGPMASQVDAQGVRRGAKVVGVTVQMCGDAGSDTYRRLHRHPRRTSIVAAAPAHEAVRPAARRKVLEARLHCGELEREVGDAAWVARTGDEARTLHLWIRSSTRYPYTGPFDHDAEQTSAR